MTKAEKIEKILEDLEPSTDFAIMKEMKLILNKVFGEDNNQIIKPNLFTMKRMAYEYGDLSNFLNILSNSEGDNLKHSIKLYFDNILYYQIIIKFPEVEITNGNQKHTIYDLYVRIFVRPNGTIVSGIDGIRGKLSIFEVRSQYLHSHLPHGNATDLIFQEFCTGIGPINQVMMLLGKEFTKPNFMMFCLHLKVFVAWESKEGRPHMYLEDINKTNSTHEYHLYPSYVPDISRLLIAKIKTLDLEEVLSLMDYNVLPTKIVVQMNEKFEKWASKEILSWEMEKYFPGYGLDPNCLLNTKDFSGRYHAIPKRDSPSDHYNSDKVLFQFKGEDIKLQVEIPEIPDTEIIKDEEKVPNPQITKFIGEKFSSNFSTEAFRNARIRLACAGSD